MNIINIPSPNFYAGRSGYTPEAIIIHIMEGTLSGTDSWFKSALSKVSAHYGIGKNGEVHQYVMEKDTAWHAGRVNAPSWSLIKPAGGGLYINPNYYTVGIEHEGNDNSDWTDEMYNASSSLIKDISDKWNIQLDRKHIIGHHEIYSLKTCPGNKVDINKLIALASGVQVQLSITSPPTTLQTEKVTTITRLNIRNKPQTTSAPVNLVEPGIQLAVDGYTENGENIKGNSKWYFTTEGNWFWAGGVI
jgi:N-acetylmuramoyl-L-alanine amidase